MGAPRTGPGPRGWPGSRKSVPITGQTHKVVIEGATATVRLGYRHAATLGRWRVEGDRFTASVQHLDAFRITQGPLTLEIPNRDGIPTIRSLVEVTVVQGQLTARLIRPPH